MPTGYIYRIAFGPHSYIGSTTDFYKRLQQHTYFINPDYDKYNTRCQVHIKAHDYGITNFWNYIDILERVDYTKKCELMKREQQLIGEHNPDCNVSKNKNILLSYTKMPEITDKTLMSYENTLRVIARKVGATFDDEGKWIDKHFDEIKNAIDSYGSMHTKKNYWIAFVSMGKLLGIDKKNLEYATKRMLEEREEVEKKYMTNEMSKEQEDNWVTVEDIDNKIKELKDHVPKSIPDYQDYKRLMLYLIVLIHRDMPFRNDLADAQIYLKKDVPEMRDDVNYIILNKNTKTAEIVLNNYKTRSVYHQKTLTIPVHIAKELIKYYDDIIRISPNHWFIRDRSDDDRPISRTVFSKWFSSVWDGKRVGSTQIRRSIVTDLYKPKEGELEKKENLANVMGHSMLLAQEVYAKVVRNQKMK